MSKDIRVIREDCCNIWNNLKDKTQMIDYLIESKQQIADLEAKLAERNEYFSSFGCEDFNEFQDFISTFMLTPHEEQELIQQLKHQLAEKEKEIEYEIKAHHETIKDIEFLKRQHNQDKISFCIEQLEKVKNGIESKVESIYKRLDDLNIKIVCESTSMQLDTYEEIAKEIDNQIEELKKEMK